MAGRRRPSVEDIDTEIVGLDTCDGAALAARWRGLTGRLPGPGLKGELLRWAIACRLQEQAFGGLSPASLRKLGLMARAHGGAKAGEDGVAGKAPSSRNIKPGSRLIREWKGVIHEVVVEAEGYRWNGSVHASLSSIARAITGTSWNGWRFFGAGKPSAAAQSRVDRVRSHALADPTTPAAHTKQVMEPAHGAA